MISHDIKEIIKVNTTLFNEVIQYYSRTLPTQNISTFRS